jgi:hypothetical protein
MQLFAGSQKAQTRSSLALATHSAVRGIAEISPDKPCPTKAVDRDQILWLMHASPQSWAMMSREHILLHNTWPMTAGLGWILGLPDSSWQCTTHILGHNLFRSSWMASSHPPSTPQSRTEYTQVSYDRYSSSIPTNLFFGAISYRYMAGPKLPAWPLIELCLLPFWRGPGCCLLDRAAGVSRPVILPSGRICPCAEMYGYSWT